MHSFCILCVSHEPLEDLSYLTDSKVQAQLSWAVCCIGLPGCSEGIHRGCGVSSLNWRTHFQAPLDSCQFPCNYRT